MKKLLLISFLTAFIFNFVFALFWVYVGYSILGLSGEFKIHLPGDIFSPGFWVIGNPIVWGKVNSSEISWILVVKLYLPILLVWWFFALLYFRNSKGNTIKT